MTISTEFIAGGHLMLLILEKPNGFHLLHSQEMFPVTWSKNCNDSDSSSILFHCQSSQKCSISSTSSLTLHIFFFPSNWNVTLTWRYWIPCSPLRGGYFFLIVLFPLSLELEASLLHIPSFLVISPPASHTHSFQYIIRLCYHSISLLLSFTDTRLFSFIYDNSASNLHSPHYSWF